MLASDRVSKDREFFRVSPLHAVESVRDALLDVAGIDAWSSGEIHRVRHGDRIALTVREGDIFVVLAYPALMSNRARPLDLRQAHADGDLLELMGVAGPGSVAGISDYDADAELDPVPYLDRAETRPNGMMNGRERLVTGDRVLWVRPTAEGSLCGKAVFEVDDYCQVVSRTWDPKLTPDGWPLLLEYPTADEQPECVIRATLDALDLPRPRSWAPRDLGTGEVRAATGFDGVPPEYWLTQLSKQRRTAPLQNGQ